MLKVNNRKVVLEVAKTTYKANKKRNLLTIFAIFLTTFLISVVISLGASYWNTISFRQIGMYGMDYDIALTEPRNDQVEKIRSMDNVKYAGICVKCAIGSMYQDKQLDKLKLYWIDDVCWKEQTIPAWESYRGQYPKQENEIMLSGSALADMGIDKPYIGMELPISYSILNEDIADPAIEKTFVLSGWYLDYSGNSCGYISKNFYEETGVKQTDLTQGELKISLTNPLYSEKNIVNMQKQINLAQNQIVIADYDTISSFCKVCIGLFAMLLMIFCSGYLFIRNTMNISVTKDIRYYGQLKTIGMTSVQLQKMIYRQVIWNSLAGIPLGIIVSAIIIRGIIPQTLHIINPTIAIDDVANLNIEVCLLAAVFSFVTTVISSSKPVKMVKECSPVEAINYITVSNKKNRKRESGTVFSMATQNMVRDKKQTLIILLSFCIGVSLFMVVNTIIHENDAKLILNQSYTYDMKILNQTLLDDQKEQAISDDMIAEIESIQGVKQVRKVLSTEAVIPYQENVYGDYYKELYQSRYSPGNYDEDIAEYKNNPNNNQFTCRFIAIDENEFNRINSLLETPIKKSDFEKGKVAFCSKTFTEGKNNIPGKDVQFLITDGNNPQKTYSIQIADVIPDNPAYYAAGYSPDLIVSESYAKTISDNMLTELINIEYDNAFSADTELAVKDVIKDNPFLSYESKLERYSEMKNSENQIRVFGNSIGVIILLLAIMNYLNMMVASIQNRVKEFAILESIGMTTKQIKKMITLEGGGYALISLLLSVIIGTPLCYVVFHGLNIYRLSFSIPIISNVVLYIVVLVVCLISPMIIFKKINRLSIIEQLRQNDN